MKRAVFYCSALLLSLCYILSAQQYDPRIGEEIREKTKAEKDKIKSLVEAGLYDSAISYCAWLRKNDKMDYDNLEQSLATIYYFKGDKETAYQYIINQTDYAWKIYTADAFSDAMSDFEYAYPIATDTVLEKIICDKIRDYYLQQDFPQASAGLKIIMLDYRLSKYTARYFYDAAHTKDKQQLQLLSQKLNEERQEISKEFLDLLHDHGRFCTYKEAGNGYRFQSIIAGKINDITFHKELQPYFEKAFHRSEITPESYVNELLMSSGIPVSDSIGRSLVRDSLCKIYKCRPLIRNVIHYKNGDSAVQYIIDEGVPTIRR